jgi:hypothetical protein
LKGAHRIDALLPVVATAAPIAVAIETLASLWTIRTIGTLLVALAAFLTVRTLGSLVTVGPFALGAIVAIAAFLTIRTLGPLLAIRPFAVRPLEALGAFGPLRTLGAFDALSGFRTLHVDVDLHRTRARTRPGPIGPHRRGHFYRVRIRELGIIVLHV